MIDEHGSWIQIDGKRSSFKVKKYELFECNLNIFAEVDGKETQICLYFVPFIEEMTPSILSHLRNFVNDKFKSVFEVALEMVKESKEKIQST